MNSNIIEYIEKRFNEFYLEEFNKYKHIIYTHDFSNECDDIFYYSNVVCLNCLYNLNKIIWDEEMNWNPQSCNELIIKRLLE